MLSDYGLELMVSKMNKDKTGDEVLRYAGRCGRKVSLLHLTAKVCEPTV